MKEPSIPVIKSNFDDSFLHDFGLHGAKKDYTGGHLTYIWKYTQKAKDRFHLPITYHNQNGPESDLHYSFKQKVHDHIYENYYLSTDDCKFYVTSELEQVRNPFNSYIDGEQKVFYTLDVCAIRQKDNQVFDFEIDTGTEHYTQRGMMKADLRDRLLNNRYGIYTMRIDPFEEGKDINRKKIDKFLEQPACKNPHYDIEKRKVID